MIIETFLSFLSKIFCFTSYVSGGNSFPPPLKADEEQHYVQLMANGDMYAREKLIQHNLRLVAHVVKKYSTAGEADDLISVGTIGLIKGIESYQYGKGSLLATYVAKCIDNEILMYIRANKKHRNNLSLSDAVGVDKDGNEITLMDVIPSDDENRFLKIEDSVVMEKVMKIIQTKLNGRERKIINMRYGLDGEEPKTQLEVSEILNISRSYVSRLEKKIIAQIGKYL
jgi:RNA polymerase sporulation-specific sigma factor